MDAGRSSCPSLHTAGRRSTSRQSKMNSALNARTLSDPRVAAVVYGCHNNVWLVENSRNSCAVIRHFKGAKVSYVYDSCVLGNDINDFVMSEWLASLRHITREATSCHNDVNGNWLHNKTSSKIKQGRFYVGSGGMCPSPDSLVPQDSKASWVLTVLTWFLRSQYAPKSKGWGAYSAPQTL